VIKEVKLVCKMCNKHLGTLVVVKEEVDRQSKFIINKCPYCNFKNCSETNWITGQTALGEFGNFNPVPVDSDYDDKGKIVKTRLELTR